ncbi:hypothetical protein LIER_20528 [Lithospermum erythrorhizon]|uniref:Uncharacterized protein n=1 Tax=Lithospermum erythrorhizon TaxID=34254 RepID=A0AAV3QSG6_LITER
MQSNTRRNRWQTLSTDGETRVSSARIDSWKTQQSLATRAHDMELSIAANKVKTKYEVRKPADSTKISKKDANVVTLKSSKFSFKTKKMEGGLNLGDKGRLTLKEMQAKEYPFFDSDIPAMFDKLTKAKLDKGQTHRATCTQATRGGQQDYDSKLLQVSSCVRAPNREMLPV